MHSEQPFRTGDRLLDRFRIGSVFTGGMGVLCAVTDEHTGQVYAVKTVKPDQRSNPEVVDRFREEASTWIDLDHNEHLVQALWMEEDPAGPFLFLEFIDGPDLARLLEGGALELPRAVDLGMQCASGMAYAHAKPFPDGVGVVHRDLKPSNLLLTADDCLKVADFGLARVFRPGAPSTAEATAGGFGTLEYMAPEQLRSAGSIDGRSDVYSFGLVLYEMLTGENPLRAEELPEQLQRVLTKTPPPLTEVPPALEALVARCVAKEPDERPRDFREVLAHLAQIARSLDYPWRVDPAAVPPPARPLGATATAPALRPRRPRAGEPFVLETELSGDIGPGPVEVRWELRGARGLKLLTPGGATSVRVAAGGGVRLRLRLHAVAESEGQFGFEPSAIAVSGPDERATIAVDPFEVEVAFSFHLPLRNRDEAMARVREGIDRTREGDTGILTVSGPAGSGKSRLLLAAERYAAERGVRSVEARADTRGLRPLRLLNDVVRDLVGVPAGDTRNRAVARRVASAVHDLLSDDDASARYFIDFLRGETAFEQEAPASHRWYSLIGAAARRQPLILILDELQHADETVIRVLLDAAARAREDGLPILFLMALASGEAADSAAEDSLREGLSELCGDGRFCAQIELEPLRYEDVNELLDSVFPGHGFAEEAPWLARSLWKLTSGNPAHLSEILRALRLGVPPQVHGEEGQWRLDPALTPEKLERYVPDALEGAVRHRLEPLRETTRSVLDVAAFAGREFDVEVVRAVVGGPIEDALAELEDADLIAPTDQELDRYRFRVGLVPAVVEHALEFHHPERARRLHLDLAGAMIEVYRGERVVRRALGVAQHLRAGGAAPRSLRYTLVGCERLLSLELPERARQLLAAAEPFVEHAEVPESQRTLFRYLFGSACEAAGDYSAGYRELTRFVESLAESDAPVNTRSLARAYTRLGRIHQARGEYDRAEYSFEVARQFLEEEGDRRALAFAYVSLGSLSLERGHVVQAQRHWEHASNLAKTTRNEGAAIQAAILRGGIALVLDERAAAREAFGDAHDRALFLSDRKHAAAALEGLSRVDLASGYLARAVERIEEALRLYARMGFRHGLARALLRHGEVLQAMGRTDLALREFRRAQKVYDDVGHAEGAAVSGLRVGGLLRARGRLTSAMRYLAAASETLSRLDAPHRSEALRELGRALAESGNTDASRVALARADRVDRSGIPRRSHRVESRALRADLFAAAGDLRRARMWALRALRHSRRSVGHRSRIAAHLASAEVGLKEGADEAARKGAETALAFAHEEGDVLAAASCERVLMELAARAGDVQEAGTRAHRAARAYTGRFDAGAGPARLLAGLGRGLERVNPSRAHRLSRAARHCYDRLEAWGFRREIPE